MDVCVGGDQSFDTVSDVVITATRNSAQCPVKGLEDVAQVASFSSLFVFFGGVYNSVA